MSTDDYVPIDCDFHDELEAAATLKKPVKLVLELTDHIVELGHERPGEPKGEYMTLKSGLRVRFDAIVSVDGKPRPR